MGDLIKPLPGVKIGSIYVRVGELFRETMTPYALKKPQRCQYFTAHAEPDSP